MKAENKSDQAHAEQLAGVRLMQQIGGGFAQALAAAWLRADSRNRDTLTRAFDEMFAHYAGLAKFENEENTQ